MAKGDVRHSRRSSGGGGSSNVYDDEGRGFSKTLWEEFEKYFSASGYSVKWLMDTAVVRQDKGELTVSRFLTGSLSDGLYDGRVLTYLENMTWRYDIHDWAWRKFEDDDRNDGRMRRLIVKKCGVKAWTDFQERAAELNQRYRDKRKKENAERAEEWEQQMAAHRAAQIKRDQEEVRTIMSNVEPIAGALQSDFHHAFSLEEAYSRVEGDWLDDPVSGYQSGYGFGEEVRRPSGIKLQVTVSLDLSNSMANNGVHAVAAESFRDIYLALEQLKDEHPNDLHICAFTFSDDGYKPSERGKRAKNLTVIPKWSADPVVMHSNDTSLGAVNDYRTISKWSHFRGEDTWFYPLFELIEKWEKVHSDPGAIKLDIIITDAVIEHPSDIRRSDKIQERRDGTLHTVVLNFLPETDWVNSDLPLRCVQYGADKSNIGGMLRTLISEFVNVYL